jgi:hypothetical protein
MICSPTFLLNLSMNFKIRFSLLCERWWRKWVDVVQIVNEVTNLQARIVIGGVIVEWCV